MNSVHIPHIVVLLIVPVVQEAQAAQLQDHPEKHKHSLDLNLLTYGGINLTINVSLLRTMVTRYY